MRYEKYIFLYPPRPENRVPKDMIRMYKDLGWWWQPKMNGTGSVIFTNGRSVVYKTRHNEDHKLWKPLPEHDEFFKGVAVNGNWTVLSAELLHSKVKGGLRNHFVVNDVLVHDGEILTDMHFKRRDMLLKELVPSEDDMPYPNHRINEYVSRSGTFDASCAHMGMDMAESGNFPELEGIVLKDPMAYLGLPVTPGANSHWQAKCRIGHKNYGFIIPFLLCIPTSIAHLAAQLCTWF